MSAALALLLSLLLSQDLPAVAEAPWTRLWAEGQRLAAVDTLEQAVAAADAGANPALLAAWQLAIHRYEAARQTAAALGAEGRAARARADYLLGDYERALTELDPGDPLESRMRVDALEVLGRDEALDAALDQATAVVGADDPDLLAARGRLHARRGDHEQAAVVFRAALAADPVHTMSLHGLGRALLRLGRRSEAQAVLQEHERLVPLIDARDHALRALDLAPLHAANHAQLGDVERALGRLDEAEQCFERAASLARGVELTPVALRHARLLAEDRQDLDGAVALLLRSIERFPDLRLVVRAGDLLLQAGRAAEALEQYQAADTAQPGDPQIAQRLRAARALLGAEQ